MAVTAVEPSQSLPAVTTSGEGEGTVAPEPADQDLTQVAPDAISGPTTTPRSRRVHWAVFISLVLGVVLADQLVKAWIVANFDVNVANPILGDYLRIWLSHNTGALFGMFPDQAIIFAFFSSIVMGVIVWYESRAGQSLIVSIALGLLLGGAIGNLLDRLRFNYVVDFMDLGIGTWRWYTFNVADAAISASVVLLFVLALVPGLAESPRDA